MLEKHPGKMNDSIDPIQSIPQTLPHSKIRPEHVHIIFRL